MKLSILTATFNRGDLLQRLYESIIKNLKTNIDIEWLIMDDGSNDDTEKIISNMRDENKIYIRYLKQVNQGKMAAINHLMDYVRGDLIIECDSDDYFTENAFLYLKDAYEESKYEKDLYGLCFLKYDQNGNNIGNEFKNQKTTMFDLYFKELEDGEKAIAFFKDRRKNYSYELEGEEKFVTEARMYHKMDLYYKIKCYNEPIMICEYQKDDDILIYGETCKKYIHSKIKNNICISDCIKDRNITTENNSIQILEDETNLVGEHNFFDIAVSYYICSKIYKISNEEFKSALKDFKGLAHRLEYVTTKDNVEYYDDSISTIGETTIEGIKALKNVNTLILGGMDRQIDYSNLEDFIIQDENLENLILMPDTGTRIYKELQEKGNTKKCYLVNNLEEAVKRAKEVTKKDTICLLSPAAASYGFFKNFEERGNTFQDLVSG